MSKNIQICIIAFVLFVAVFLFFNKAYQELTTYSELTNRHNTIHSSFQNLSEQLNNAAVLNPDLIKATNSTKAAKLFFSDRQLIMRQLAELKTTVRDTVNAKIVAKLDTVIRQELSWIIESNVPDSIIDHKAPEHIAAFQNIDSLINLGIQRTIVLANYRKQQLNEEIRKLRSWMGLFIILSAVLFVYITISLFRQQSKRKKKERELEIVLNRISDGVVSVDNNWRYTFLNDAAMVTHPFSRQETLGKVIWEVHPEMKGTIFWDKYHEAMRTKKVVEIESYYVPMDIWFSVKVYPSADGLTIFYKNVTENKKAEEKLSQTLKEVTDYKLALDEASIVAITDHRGIIKHANDNFCKISKYSRDELIGKDHRIINSGYHSKAFIKNLWATIASGKVWKGDIKNKAKDGTVYWVDTTIVPFLDNNGKPYQYVAIRSDITQQKEVEEKLIKSEKIYRTIASSIPGSVICLLDTEYKYLLIEGDMLENMGYSREMLLGNKAQDVLPPDVFASVEKEFTEVFKGKTITLEYIRRGYDIIAKFIPLKDENNNVYALMTVATDITKLKNAQRDIIELNHELEEKVIKRTEQLKNSNEELESFSYSVSHDLRAPLRAVNGYAKILEEDYTDLFDKEGRRLLTEIQNNATKMGVLIDDLLAFSRLGRKEVEKSFIDMNKMAELAIWEINQTTTQTAEIKYGGLLPAMADPALLQHVMINLISNAIKYSSKKERPVIEIKSKQVNKELVYSISDNGVGFDMQYGHKLFGVFQRLHSHDEFPGTGVGLAIVQRIIHKHKGNVWAEGKLGQGATFYFTLPQTDHI